MADIQINELLESTTAADSDWIAIDNGTATKKISVRNFNATGAASAAQSAAAAAQSASAALASQTAAEQAEDDAQALITSAQTIVSDAQTYANEAATSAGTASTAANTATAQAAIATQAATQAGTYAQNVDSFAKTAKSWAVGGTGTRQGEDTDNSKYYSQQAHDSEINAAASEQAAATSETNAAASETNAAASEANAAQSESNASASATSAASSASSALTSANNAATSETNAAASETNADLSSEDSEAWSVGQRNGVDVPPSDPTYHNNAKYWADVASGGVSGVASFNGRSGNVVPALGDYDASIVEFDNSSNGFQSTNTQDAIEEVQDNVDDVASDLTTLDRSLKPVAKSGAYNDLTGLPTLGAAAAKNSTNAVSPGSTDLVESGAVYDIADGLNNAILGNATAIAKAYKYDDTADTAMDDADYIPFYDTSAQTKKKILKPDLVGKVLPAQTLAVGATSLTFTDSSIGNNSRISVKSNPFTSGLVNAVQNGNTVTLTFDAQEVALSVTLEVRN